MFNVETDCGIATASVNGKYIDAGRAGEIAGLEFSVDKMRMFDQPRESRHANAVITLDCTPAVLLQMAMVILDKLDLPAFNAREWRLISNALQSASMDSPDGAEMRKMAASINTAAEHIEAL